MHGTLHVIDPTSTLHTIDPATASPRTVGAVGVGQVTDIAFHGPTLYGVTFSQLLRLDPATGAGTPIGATGFSTNGLAAAGDGALLAGTTNGELVTIDPTTGAGTLVGSFGGGLTSSGDLAFDSNGVLFGTLERAGTVVLATVDRTTGAATPIGPTGVAHIYGLAFHCCRLLGGTDAGELVELNVATGAATVIARNSLTQWGMAVGPCRC